MKVYPKVPHFDHPTVEDGFFDSSDLIALEKVDGSNFRFSLYDERFEEFYDLQDINAEDGDIVVATKKRVRGTLDEPTESFYGNLRRAVDFLKQSAADSGIIRDFHSEYGSPLVFFAENMVRHSLDYNYDTSPPPPLLGFDVYSPKRDPRDSIPSNRWEDTFVGFLDYNEVEMLFSRIGIPMTPEVNITFEELENSDFPESNIAEGVTMEGVVFRSDSMEQRVKKVREQFQEKNREAFGINESQARSGEEIIVARYCTNGRIRKIVTKMVVDEGRDFGLHLNEELYKRVYDDIWQENWPEIKEADFEFNPSEVKPLVAKRCIETLKRMKVNSELNNSSPVELWPE